MIVNRVQPFVTFFGDIFVFPGINTFDDFQTDVLMKNKNFKEQVELGFIELVHSKDEKAKPTEDIAKMSFDVALDLISKTLSIPELEKMAADKRKPVKEAVKKQLLMIRESGESS